MTSLANADRRVGLTAWLALGAAGLLGGTVVAVAGPLPVVAVIGGLLALSRPSRRRASSSRTSCPVL
jgi:hypothetical protein